MKNALVYAYIGDSVYECFVRKHLIDNSLCKLKELQKESLNFVSAKSQRRIFEYLEQNGVFNEKELEIARWGRNAHGGKSKAADIVTYRIATGFETLIGWLVYENNISRVEEIMERVVNNESIW